MTAEAPTMPRRAARNRDLARRNAKIYNAVALKGKTQAQVAEQFGVTPGLVCQIVNNPFSHEYH